MTEHRFFRRVPVGMLGMFGLIVVVETLLGAAIESTDQVASDWVHGSLAVRRVGAGYDTLLMGDSLVKLGLMPEVFDRQSGRRSTNLAITAGQASTTYFMLQRALEAGAKPEAVVVCFDPGNLSSHPEMTVRYWAELASVRESVELAWEHGDAGLLARLLTARCLPSYRARHELRERVRDRLADRVKNRRAEVNEVRRLWRQNRGAQPMPQNPWMSDAWAWSVTRPQPWRPRLANLRYVLRFLELAASRNIRVYWVIPPTHPAMQAARQTAGFDAAYSRFVDRALARFPNLTVLDGRRAEFPPQVFFDHVHLSREGATVFSRAIAEAMGPTGSPPPSGLGRILLPSYHQDSGPESREAARESAPRR